MTLSWNLLFAGVFLALFVAVALYAIAVPGGDRRWGPLAALLAGLAIAGLIVTDGLVRMLLIDGAAFAAVALVWARGTPEAARAARVYLALLILAALCIAGGMLAGGITGEGPVPQPAFPLDRLALGLLLAGFALKLALVPLYFWLPGVAASAAPMTTALIVSIVDIAAFTELADVRVAAPWLFAGAGGLWVAVALLSMFGGALLALAQRDMKRMLAFSSIDDMGYLLLGVVAGPGFGLTGALIGALSHSLLKVLLFGSVGIAEQRSGRAIDLDRPDCRGLLVRYPVSGIAFIIGALGMIGIPPILGFAGRWRLYLAGLSYGGTWLGVAMMASTGLALLYWVRATHRVWFGPAPAGEGVVRGEPALAAGVLAVLATVAVVLGFFPGLLTALLP